MRIVVTGGAGFIGSHVVERLIKNGNEITVLDNLSSGKEQFIAKYINNPNCKLHKVSLLHDALDEYFKSVDQVWHLAANSDVRLGIENPLIDFEQNVVATLNVLEAMRRNNGSKMIFTSSSSVYGEPSIIPTPENYSPLVPVSLYGASKLSSEALIASYCHSFGINASIFRLANIIGSKLTHGVIYDFINKLHKNPNELEILGDGNQTKSYLHVEDCVSAMLIGSKHSRSPVDIFNLGSPDTISVKEIAEILCSHMHLAPKFNFVGGKKGWKGDVATMQLDISKILKLGWKPEYNSKGAIEKTVESLV